jgi:hypothetical protein
MRNVPSERKRRTDPRTRESDEQLAVAPDAPAGAPALPPHKLASWLVSAFDLKVIAWSQIWPSVVLSEQAAHRDLVVALATELYHRERGVLSPSEEALVGPYLESLPDDGSPDLADAKTPVVE